MVEVARARGYELGTDLKITSLTNLGDRDTLEALTGLPYYRSYGFHEVQWIAQECPARDGLHVYEDAFVVQVVDPESGEPVPDGQTGSLVITELYKTGSPQFRYNNMDLSYLYPREHVRAAAGCGGSGRSPGVVTTWSSCGASTSGPRRSATWRWPFPASRRTISYAPSATGQRDEMILSHRRRWGSHDI